ncbi:plasmid pRiA4b ORF-3 family protein [Levilactobacillus tujiorum]|uniref:Plasmid pRiA4b ORF-3 family protein n=1 Tax=Levilactobacillus tujiorum TaxID=2912243 RepID=A0ABX1L6J8_9LACO|nr:plasmid pRiA4b ORF-3 family protein [Levilactobacillus tujiorum]MCH5465673.1 plasmid pRiA4b ORF-3 family protein [Levilactobacillus tujiorum]NLR12805.1 plasmid pRiA4b ORF-3 family protein [Lactobacillus sp. HBUAS51387]NLR30685.1 plasmid pRiA4b ORF-3 family protein [Levilactobacillus tujiorum]
MTAIAAMEILIKLKDVKPAVSRKLIVPATIRYDQLHVLIQLAFGWTNSHLYSFQPAHQHGVEYTAYMDDMGISGVTQIPAERAYVYPDLQQGEVVYTYDFGEDWKHIVMLKRTLTFDEISDVQVPSCTWNRGTNRAEDGRPAEAALPFNQKNLNERMALWSRAGEQMIRADDLGLMPEIDW